MEVFKQLPELVEQLEKDWAAFKDAWIKASAGQEITTEKKDD